MSRRKVHIDQTAFCACGRASIALAGPVLGMFLCSCTECQKATGAGHSAVAIMRDEHVRLDGEVREFSRPAESGATLTRYFCPACAVTMRAESSRAPGISLIPAGLIGGSEWFRPDQVIFHRSHLDWDRFPDQIALRPTYRES